MIKILDFLVCPVCKRTLGISGDYLLCSRCGSKYEIKKGIPVMVNFENLPSHFKKQIEFFSHEEITQSFDYSLEAWQKSYVERFLNHFNPEKDSIIMDCGTGSGHMAVELAKRGHIVIASDLTFRSLVRLKNIKSEHNLESLHLICCNAEELPIKDNSVDYFISNAVLEHLPNEKNAIEEINRVSKKGTGALITVPLKLKYVSPILIPLNYFHDKRIGHLRRYSEKDMKMKFDFWQIEKIKYTGHFKKVLKAAVNIFYNLFDTDKIEIEDKNSESQRKGASNLIAFLRKVEN